jgi:hypothetical protein
MLGKSQNVNFVLGLWSQMAPSGPCPLKSPGLSMSIPEKMVVSDPL